MSRLDKDIVEPDGRAMWGEVAGGKFAVLRCERVPRGELRVEKMNEAGGTATENAAEMVRDGAPASEPGFLWDFWYPAMPSARIRGRRLASAMLLEVPLVL